jgi:VWFA-related protein
MLRNLPVRIALSSALILNLAAGPVMMYGQQAPSDLPTITIRANTRLVTLDVVVTDKKGDPVSGLKAENFTLEENGKKQKISIFVPPGILNKTASTPLPPGVLSNHPENVGPAGVPTVLLLDACNSPFKDQSYARTQMLKYVLEQGKNGHTIAVFTLSDQLRVLQQFTSDPQVLMTAITKFRPEEPILQAGAPRPETHGIADGPNGGAPPPDSPMAPLTPALAAAMAVQQFADLQISYNLERRTQITLEAMKALSRILGGLPGRKNVVWLTASLPFDLVPEDRNVTEAELLADLPGQGAQRSVSVNAAGSYAAEARQVHSAEIKDAESKLASADIAIYPVDLTGLMSGMESSANQQGSVFNDTAVSDRAISTLSTQQTNQGTMEEVALQTGGKIYKNQNEIKDGVTLAISDDKASYLLGYYPENKKWDGKLRSLKIKVDQADVHLRYRKGFFAVEPGPTKNTNYDREVAAALEIGAPATQVSFMAQAKSTEAGKVRVIFLVDAHTLTAEDSGGSMKMNVSLYASLYDANGKNLGTQGTKIDQTFDAATYQKILEQGMKVPIDMALPAGATQVRAAVLDGKTGFIGTASGPIAQ